ncbi:MAG: CPBP family glutamic-type intramembrane protease [Spirochaetia bacterium]|nr:CPBP family glutamic-type intramembrane protease [Spirochaetia bacterium]
MTLNLNLSHFFLLLFMGSIGAVAIMPYAMAMQSTVEFTPALILISILQGIILSAIAIFVGMLASRSLGLSIWSEPNRFPAAILLGVCAGVLVLLLELFIFLPNLPEALTAVGRTGHIAPWKGLLAGFYGGINEELMMRFFMLSGLLWIVTRFWHSPEGGAVTAAFWIINIFIGTVFGLGHLPAIKAVTDVTPFLIIRSIVLNLGPGVVFGWIFWKWGLSAAMVSHFSADMVLHVINPWLTRVLGLGGGA